MPGLGVAPPAGQAATPRRPAAGRAEAEGEEVAAAAAAPRRDVAVAGLRGGGPGSGAAAASLPAAVRGALELAEARRRLLEAESRRRLVSELESRVRQLHRVFLEAELRLADRAESLGRLGGGVAQAELHLAAHGQRLKKHLRRSKKVRPPALLASALALGGCVPWAACRARRGGRAAGGGAAAAAAGPEPPESPFRRNLQAAPPGEAAPRP